MTEKIGLLLEETNTSFNMMLECGGHPNTDFAGYAANTRIGCFRSALQTPDLSRAQLAAMLRRAARMQKQSKGSKGAKSYWRNFMADYITQHANANTGD